MSTDTVIPFSREEISSSTKRPETGLFPLEECAHCFKRVDLI